MCAILFLSVTLLLTIQWGAALNYPQILQAYHNESCVGTFTEFFDSRENITGEFPYIQHKSTSLKGLWRYELKNVDYEITTIRRSFNGIENCDSSVIGGKVVHLTSVQKLAAGDLDDSVLTLYPLELFGGEPVVVDNKGASLIVNFTVSSYVFTGPQSFTVFDQENFTGNATCLLVENASRDDGLGVSMQWGFEPLPVVSAKLGCDGNEGRHLNSNVERTGLSLKSKEGKPKSF